MEPKHPKSPQTGPWTCLLCAAGDPIPRPQQIPIHQRNGRNPALGPSNDAHNGRHPVPSARHPAGMDAHRSVAEPPSATVTLAEIDRDKTRMDTPELGQPCSPPIPAKRDPAASLLEPARLSRESRTVGSRPGQHWRPLSTGRPSSQCWIRSCYPHIRGPRLQCPWQTAPLWSDGAPHDNAVSPSPCSTLPPVCEAAENDEQTSPSDHPLALVSPEPTPLRRPHPPRASLALSALSAGSLASRVPVPDARGRRQPIRTPVPPPSPKMVARSQSSHRTRRVKAMSPWCTEWGARFDVVQSARRQVATPPSRLWGRLRTVRRRHAGYVTGAGILLNAGNLCQRQPRAIFSSSPGPTALPSRRLVFLSQVALSLVSGHLVMPDAT